LKKEKKKKIKKIFFIWKLNVRSFLIFKNKNKNWIQSQVGREYPLNLSISLSGGKETN